MRRAVGIVSILVGLALIVTPFATKMFERTRGAEVTFNAMRGLVSEEGIAIARRNYGITKAGGEQFVNEAEPGLAKRLDLSSEEFQALLQRDFPRIARGAERLPTYLGFVGPTIVALDANRDEFRNADALPGANLPLTAAPWLILILGVLMVGAGVFALLVRGRWALAPVVAVATIGVVVPLALGIPSKARDARDVGDIARGGLSQKGADTAVEIVDVLDGMVADVKGLLVPEVARRLHVTPSDVSATLSQNYPATTRLLNNWEAIAAGETGAKLAFTQEAVVDDFADADKTPALELPWLVIGPSALLLLVGGAGLLVETRRRRSAVATAA
jgi:hypothetical protein